MMVDSQLNTISLNDSVAKYVGQSTKEVAAKESKGKIILKVHDSDS